LLLDRVALRLETGSKALLEEVQLLLGGLLLWRLLLGRGLRSIGARVLRG
jgi:hypothetical protein